MTDQENFFVKTKNPILKLNKKNNKVILSTKESYYNDELIDMISSLYKISKKQVVVSSCCTEAIYLALNEIIKEDKIDYVAVPGYICKSVIDAIISIGLTPYLYDIDDEMVITEENLKIYCNLKASTAIILVNYFGRTDFKKIIDILITSKKYSNVIFDEAQSFPLLSKQNQYIGERIYSVISFGHSKPICSLGGGALVAHSQYLNSAIKLNISIPKQQRSTSFSTIEELASSYVVEHVIPKELPQYAIQSIIKNISFFNYENEVFINFFKKFKFYLPPNISKYLKKNPENQVNLPIYIENNRNRFMELLAVEGIETTFYYYPIDKISTYSNIVEKMGSLDNCYRIFEHILILPINRNSNYKELSLLFENIERICK